MRYLLLFCIYFSLTVSVSAQRCSISGQTPEHPYTIGCSTRIVRDSVPVCSNGVLLQGCNNGGKPFTDKNPNWYFFYCGQSGSLGFTINPEVKSDDYNWMLFDVTKYLFETGPTGAPPKSPPHQGVYTNSALVLGYNWSGKEGKTGTSVNAVAARVCPNPSHLPPYPSSFSAMPHITKGHGYLLLISHNKGLSQSGYTLSFGGGNAVIANTESSHLIKKAQAACNGKSITVFLKIKTKKITPHLSISKGIKSGSLDSDGSDFKLLHTSVKIKSASVEVAGPFIQKITLKLSGTLKQGIYTLVSEVST